jgi:hypothetical protein
MNYSSKPSGTISRALLDTPKMNGKKIHFNSRPVQDKAAPASSSTRVMHPLMVVSKSLASY